MILITGGTGILGGAIKDRIPDAYAPTREELPLRVTYGRAPHTFDAVYLCAGTKGYAENEGNRESFRADVDGNISLARRLLRTGSFVVFISTDGVEWGAHTAYARNRLLVEIALVMQPNVSIVRPAKFSRETVGPLADLCVRLGSEKIDGVHYLP